MQGPPRGRHVYVVGLLHRRGKATNCSVFSYSYLLNIPLIALPSQRIGRSIRKPPFFRKANKIAKKPAAAALPYLTPTKVAKTPKAPTAATLSPVTNEA